jgi:TPR repeat protein
MTSYRSKRALSIIPLVIITSILLGIAEPRIARAVDPDIPRIQAGAERGSVQQQIELAAAYLAGRGVPRDEKEAAYWYEKAANGGDPGAQQQIGYFYQAGIGVERNPTRAVQWFERAVAGGLVSAKVNLGVAYVWGLGGRKDPVFAAQLFREAAQKGNGTGACYLGLMYYFGLGVPKDASQAKHWLELGVKLHSIPAKYDLALVLSKEPDPTSRDRAFRLLRESAAGGVVAAKHQLGLEILHKPGLARTPNEAVALFEEAASDGFWKSSLVLGILSRDGQELAKDSKAAYYHFQIAVLQGGEKAATLAANDLRALSLELGQTQIQAIDQEAAAWVQKHNRPLEFVSAHGENVGVFPAYALLYPAKDIHAGLLLGAPDAAGADDMADLGYAVP